MKILGCWTMVILFVLFVARKNRVTKQVDIVHHPKSTINQVSELHTALVTKTVEHPNEKFPNEKNILTSTEAVPLPGDKICSFVQIHLNMHGFTPVFARASLQWLRKANVATLINQKVNVIVGVRIGNNNEIQSIVKEELMDIVTDLTEGNSFFLSFDVQYFTSTGVPATTSLNYMKYIVKHSSCVYVTTSRIDADDIVHPNIFDAMGSVIMDEFQDRQWNGGFFAYRDATKNVLLIGSGCKWKQGLHDDTSQFGFYSGTSLVQTRVLKRELFLSIGFGPSGSHTNSLQLFFQHVIRNTELNSNWVSLLPPRPSLQPHCDSPKIQNCTRIPELVLESNFSGVFVRDLTLSSGLHTPGIYTSTPLSGNFPWVTAKRKRFNKQCQYGNLSLTPASKIKFDGFDLTSLIEVAEYIFQNVTILDACKSNSHFRHTQASFFPFENTTCADIQNVYMRRHTKR